MLNQPPRQLFVTLALLGLAFLPLAGQAAGTTGSGKAATETRALPEFQSIELSGSMDLKVRQGSPQSVQLQADDNLLPLLETVVEGSGAEARLNVKWKRWQSIHTRSKAVVTVVLPKLNAVALKGSGDLQLDAFNTPALKLAMSGAGDAKIKDLAADELVISLSGSGNVAGQGKATKLKIGIAGSGDVRFADLQADEVRVSIAGSGDAAVNAQKSLDVSIAGSGDVSYVGNPSVKSSVAGSGSINKR
jgi:hypothetical protein